MTQPKPNSPSPRPLDGIRVLEMGQVLAGPFAATLLGYFGAEVIKVEPPGGDPIRGWRVVQDGSSLWWHSLGRNKKCVTLDLRKPRGVEIARELILRSDVLIENFRPGTLERWGLDPEELRRERPELIVTRVSGFGQTGPDAHRPGYASVCEAAGGLRYVTGFADQAPVRSNLSIGDSLAGMHAAFGIVLALLQRGRPGGSGQVVDVAITESVFNMLEAVVPEYSGAGVVRERSGTTITGIVPSNLYPCSDGKDVVIGANSDSNCKRLLRAAGRDDLAEDPRLQDNAGRVAHQEELDAAIADWTRTLPAEEVLRRLDEASVPGGPIRSAADLAADPHFRARGLYEEVEVAGKPLEIPALLPKLTDTPGRTEWPGPGIGEHNDEIYGELLGLSAEQLSDLRDTGVI